MPEFLFVVGRGLIKLLICLMAGFGVGLYLIGQAARDFPEFARRPEQMPAFYEGIGGGLLTCSALLILLFVIPSWLRRSSTNRNSKLGPQSIEGERGAYAEGFPDSIKPPIKRVP
jgi:hypothetical protein